MSKSQFKILTEMQSAGFNVVNCGECGSVVLISALNGVEDHECPYCGFISDPCDFPDYIAEE